MASHNYVELIGRLGRDPVVHFPAESSDGQALTRFPLATDRPGQPAQAKPNGAKPNGAKPNGAKPNGAKPNGAKPNGAPRSDYETDTDWHQIVCRGRDAEFAGRYLSKGRLVLVTGALHYRSFEDKQGEKRRAAEIVASTILALDPPPEAAEAVATAEGAGHTRAPQLPLARIALRGRPRNGGRRDRAEPLPTTPNNRTDPTA